MQCIKRVFLASLLVSAAGMSPTLAQPTLPSTLLSARRGDVVRVDSLGVMNRAQLAEAVDFLPERVAVHGEVALYRIVYVTALHDRPVQASGLLVVPQGRTTMRGVVAFLHGTNVTAALAPSQPDRVDGNEEAAVFGGNGYVVVLPDYIGLGESTDRQAYMLAQPQVDATVDLLRAVRRVAGGMEVRWNPSLMLLGFSQGGYNVAALHRALEGLPLDGYSLRGSAAVAGAYALRREALPYALRNDGVGYVTFTVAAYAAFYGQPLESAFLPAVAARLPALLDGSHQVDEFEPVLQEGFSGVFRADFLQDLHEQRSNWFTDALESNSVDAWVPRAPMRLYNGADDSTVSPHDAEAFHNYARARGGAVSLYSFGQIGHEESAARMYEPVLAWFDSLSARPAPCH